MRKQKLTLKQKVVGHWGNIVKAKMQVIEKFSGKNVLDVGCSTGDYVYYLNNHNYQAFGCDTLEDKRWKKSPEKFKIGNIYKLPYKNKTFDTVIAFEILEHLENPDSALKELARVTKKNVIISVPNCELPQVFSDSGLTFYHHIDKTHVNRFLEKEITNLLTQNGFTIDYVQKISPVIPEVLLLYTWHIPLFLANMIGRITKKLSMNKKIYSDLILVASVKK